MSDPAHGAWRKSIASYERPDPLRSIWQIINTCIPYFFLWYAMYITLSFSYWLALVLAVPTAGFMIRIFIIFHDCTHGSFFSSRRVNAVVGTLTGILAGAPFHQWRRYHTIHHATSGDLDRRGVGDIWTLTVEEYLALPPLKRLGYRLYRNPIVMFLLGPAFIFLISHRFNRPGAGRAERLNTYLTNLGIASVVMPLALTIGWKALVMIYAPVFLLAGAAGVWLFYVQHQFEGTYFESGSNWNYVKAALQGSSFYKLPRVLNWFTGSIGFHHIHHLSPRVPNYYLGRAHQENPIFQEVTPVTLLSSLRSLGFRMWDEHRRRLVGFRYVREYLSTRANNQ